MNVSMSPHTFATLPHRAHDVIEIIGRANRALGRALVHDTRRPARRVSKRMLDVVKTIQFLPRYLDGVATIDLESALSKASNAIAALEAAVERDRHTIAGRFAQWLHVRRHPREYMVAAPTRSGKGVGIVIPNLIRSDTVVQIYDRKADPDTRH